MNRLLLNGKIFILMLLALGAATSCKDDDEDNQPALTVQSFMQQAAASDMFEIRTGTMAITKGTLPQVRSTGQTLVTHHTMTSTELMALAITKNVTLPTTLPQDKATRVTTLENATGTAFNHQFAEMQVLAHQEAIELYEQADRDITDAQVQAFIDKTLPILRTHLTEAEQLEDLTD